MYEVAGRGGATGLTTAKVSALQETKYSEIRNLHGDDISAAYARASLAAVARIDDLVRGADRLRRRRPASTATSTPVGRGRANGTSAVSSGEAPRSAGAPTCGYVLAARTARDGSVLGAKLRGLCNGTRLRYVLT